VGRCPVIELELVGERHSVSLLVSVGTERHWEASRPDA
jgi:hypothetical protein